MTLATTGTALPLAVYGVSRVTGSTGGSIRTDCAVRIVADDVAGGKIIAGQVAISADDAAGSGQAKSAVSDVANGSTLTADESKTEVADLTCGGTVAVETVADVIDAGRHAGGIEDVQDEVSRT